MSYSPKRLALKLATGDVKANLSSQLKNFAVDGALGNFVRKLWSAQLAHPLPASGLSPHGYAVGVPARAEYSHCASVGSATTLPLLFDNQSQKAVASFQLICTTG